MMIPELDASPRSLTRGRAPIAQRAPTLPEAITEQWRLRLRPAMLAFGMIQHKDLDDPNRREVIVIGGGIAGLSAAIYLGRAQRDTLVIDSGHSMAKWEPEVRNYLGFPNGVGGEALLKYGRRQAKWYKVRFANDEIKSVARRKDRAFFCAGDGQTYRTKRLAPRRPAFFICRRRFPGSRSASGTACFFARIATATACAENESRSAARTMKRSSTRSACCTIPPAWLWRRMARSPAGAGSTPRWLEEYEIPVALRTDHRGRTSPERKIRATAFRGRDEGEDRLHLHHARGYFSYRPGGNR